MCGATSLAISQSLVYMDVNLKRAKLVYQGCVSITVWNTNHH